MTHLAPVAQASLPAPIVPLAANPAPAIVAVAEALQPDLAQGLQIDALRLRREMEHAFGGSDATGTWDWKLAYEAGEVALILFLRKFGRALLARAGSPAADPRQGGRPLAHAHPAVGRDGALSAILDAAAHGARGCGGSTDHAP